MMTMAMPDELLARSQFPVFTLYAQKVCLSANAPLCDSLWSFESVPDLALSHFIEEEATRITASRSECVEECMLETSFPCRSITYYNTTKECVMSKVNRNMVGRRPLLDMSIGAVYAEVACVPKLHEMCEFTKLRNKILKTVDAVYKDLETIEECKERCMKASFTCYSFDFMSAGEKICRLSHHSSSTLAHIQEPYLLLDNSTTYERHACYQVSVECRATEMLAHIVTSSIFDGKIYSRDRPQLLQGGRELQHRDPASTFTSNIVIQHHKMIVTSADVGLVLHCHYDIKNQTVTNSLLSGLEVRSDVNRTEFYEETVVDSPNVVMRVTNGTGFDVTTAQVGDNLALRFEITDLGSPYQIFVRHLMATDGQDNSEIMLIDGDGCPTDPTIMQEVVQLNGNGKVLLAPFQAFKFPSSVVVHFRALVMPCLPHCEPVQCHAPGFDGFSRSSDSFGKRKRREVQEADVLVVQSVHITDKFEFPAEQRQENVSVEAQGSCSSFTGVVVAGALFLAAQLVMLMAWSYLWHKKRATKQIDPTPPTPSLYHMGSSASRASSTSYLTD
ncbi:hypothetical protein O3P69_003649 [Scylla paramamosain]|uniref:Uncharacterized protein n=1 Tax=Scylla paramamosain TaxID=85552 RepID=A0AAW0UKM6_SCYPA